VTPTLLRSSRDVRTSGRAPALAPQDRRAALVEAAVPLVLAKGFDVTTKELAAAAGVAEGTIFRVFDSKDDLVLAAARSVFARTDHLDDLRAISHALPLEERLAEAVRIWQTVARRIVSVFVAFRGANDRQRLGDPHSLLDPQLKERADAILAALIAPDADRLRRPVTEVIRVMGSLVLASVHPIGPLSPASSPEDIVDLLLHGVLADPPSQPLPTDCVHGACRSHPDAARLTLPPREAPSSGPAHTAYPDR
jgi:AcrR family transcriptional regulator